MKRTSLLAVALSLMASGAVSAQSANVWQFRWQKGQVLTYRVDHDTSVNEVVAGSKVETASKLGLVKRWQVADVDAKGIATINLTLVSLRHEQTRPNGEALLFDSANLDKSTPELKESMSQYVGKVVASLRIDTQGRVIEVLQGTTKSYDSEPPFVLVFPSQALQPGQGWRRSFQVVLDPPLGTGERIPAVQTFKSGRVENGRATLVLSTDFPTPPMAAADRIPLLQKQPEGEVIFDVPSGKLIRANLAIDKTIENHQGDGSTYRFRSRYTEQLVQ